MVFSVRCYSAGMSIAALLVLTSACSSAGGGATTPVLSSTDPTPTPPVSSAPAPPNYDTAEFRNQPGLALINALPAYDAGSSGAGVIVGIIDSGIDVGNPEFQGRIHAQSADLVISGVVAPANVRAGGPNLQDEDDHGTPVASIIGAARDSVGVHGVAPESELLIFRADDDTPDDTLLGAAISEGITRSIAIGADVLNFSFGSDDAGSRAEFAGILGLTKQNDIVVATAAGNDGNADPDGSALGALDVAGDSATIIVGAVDGNGDISGFSNRAGAGADLFLVAPGELIPTTFVGASPGDTRFFSGTSSATPHVAGAAALIRELWPQLAATEVVDILLTSATDLGDPGIDPIYGRGLLNIEAAVAPLGTVTTTSISGVTTDVSTLGATLSPIFGADMSGLGNIVVFDDYDRDFRTDIGAVVRQSEPDFFRLEQALSPFDSHRYARKKIGNQITAEMRLTSRDRSVSDLSSHQIAAFAGIDPRSDVIDDSLSIAFTSEIGDGRSLTVSQGFSASAIDRMGLQMRQTPFLTPSMFEDAFLPQTTSAMLAVTRAPVSDHVSLDFLASYASGLDEMTAIATAGDAAVLDQRISNFRAGVNVDISNLNLRLEQGVRHEDGGIFNADFGGETAASTIYSAIGADWKLSKRWRLKSRYAFGYSFADTSGLGGFAEEISNLTVSQFSIATIRAGLFNNHDSLWIGVSQPLQIQSGALSLVLPTGYNQFTQTLDYSVINVPLGVNTGQLDFEAGYRLYMGRLGSVDLNLIHQSLAPLDGAGATSFIMRSGFQF